MTWIRPLTVRGHSASTKVNFLWRDDLLPIYIMDNHRTALWCWEREDLANTSFSLFHVDFHFDCRTLPRERWVAARPPQWPTVSLDDYLAASFPWDDPLRERKSLPAITWDTYLSVLFMERSNQIVEARFLTCEEGDHPSRQINNFRQVTYWDSVGNMEFWMKNNGPWIFNIDIDYFFQPVKNKDHLAEGGHIQVFSDQMIRCLAAELRNALHLGYLKVITICLSPECCGGWAPAERACTIFCDELGIAFALPPS